MSGKGLIHLVTNPPQCELTLCTGFWAELTGLTFWKLKENQVCVFKEK